jgi:hypothetical protein
MQWKRIWIKPVTSRCVPPVVTQPTHSANFTVGIFGPVFLLPKGRGDGWCLYFIHIWSGDTMLQTRRSWVRKPMRWIFSTYLILSEALGLGDHSASNRNACQKQKNKCFWAVKCSRCIVLTTLLLSVNGLSRQFVILNISQTYGPPRLVTGIVWLFFTRLKYATNKRVILKSIADRMFELNLAFLLLKWCSLSQSEIHIFIFNHLILIKIFSDSKEIWNIRPCL